MPNEDLARMLSVTPSARQLRWQRLEFYSFIHFGMNTVNDREWGTGDERPEDFTLGGFDPDQWMRAMVAADMRGVILTAKHHDGFCLWPSQATAHTIAQSPFQDGRGDIVRDVAEAARRHGLAFGIYLSPWDRHDPRWSTGRAYDDYFVAQLTELLTDYGDVFSVWFDGAQGDEPGRSQAYDWDRYIEVIRSLQPDAVINVCGPDVRWCGNEGGHTRLNEWSVVPAALRDVEQIADLSQKVDDGTFTTRVFSQDEDLGSRKALAGHDELVWYPSEVNTPIRPGWFHHASEDAQVRSPAELFAVYESAVGGNSSFLLGLAPNSDGVFPPEDMRTLGELGELVREHRARSSTDLLALSSGSLHEAGHDGMGEWPGVAPSAPTLDLRNGTGWWAPDAADPAPSLTLAVPAGHLVDGVVLKEEITASQRLEVVVVEIAGAVVAVTHSVGYQRILRFPAQEAAALTVRFEGSRGVPMIAGVAVLSRPA